MTLALTLADNEFGDRLRILMRQRHEKQISEDAYIKGVEEVIFDAHPELFDIADENDRKEAEEQSRKRRADWAK
jgi:hypothetical protein